MKTTEFFKKWWQGVKDINPVQQLQIKISFLTMQLMGMLLVIVYLSMTEAAYWVVFLFAYWLSMVYDYYVTHRMYNKFREEEKILKEGKDRLDKMMEELKKQELISNG